MFSNWNFSPLENPFAEERKFDVRTALVPLIDVIRSYDSARLKLEQKGGRMEDLDSITSILSKGIETQGRFWKHEARLIAPETLHELINDAGAFSLHLSVRTLATQMPVYYICRTEHDFWFEYGLIVEDFYLSPGYPMTDERFVKLMHFGHESYFLRLSQFRDGIAKIFSENEEAACVDPCLYDLGRHIFQAAWHEDQQLAFLASQHFDMPQFRYAIELLYLCLSGDLCALRSAINEPMKRFLQDVYPQPAIHRLLEMLPYIDGGDLNELAHRAQRQYVRLAREFGRFLQKDVIWGWRKASTSLYKLIYGNVSRMSVVAKRLADSLALQQARRSLETTSSSVIGEITE